MSKRRCAAGKRHYLDAAHPWHMRCCSILPMLTLTAHDESLREFVLLRYVLIIAVSYLVISQGQGDVVSPAAALLVAGALASNVLLGWLRPKRLTPMQVTGLVVLLDTIGLSITLALIGHVSSEFFFLYFFVLFFAALAESVVLMLIGVVAASGAYLWVLSRLRPDPVWTQEHILQIACLFSAALFYGVLVNRARQRRNEAELMEATDRDRTQLLATIAHDIGGPLHVITLGAESLKETFRNDQPTADIGSLLAAISRNSGYLKQLAARFVEYSRLRAGHLDLNPAAISVGTVIERVAAQHEREAHELGVDLTLTVAPMPTATLDELALTRALNNLVGNALRYSQCGAPVTIDARLEGAAEIVIVVGDSGPGMAPVQRADVGKPFVTTARANGGSGLGLFIVRTLVEAQGGSLATDSEGGKGTRFTIRLPLVAAIEGGPTSGRLGW
jgi:signal transduction histidine kinase